MAVVGLLFLLLLLPLLTIISWRFLTFFLASSRAANVSASVSVSVAATCAFYLCFVYCLPMIDERISFQVLLVSVGQLVSVDVSWA